MQTTSLPFYRQRRVNLNLSQRQALAIKVLQALSILPALLGILHNMVVAKRSASQDEISPSDCWIANLWCILAGYWNWLLTASMMQRWIYQYEAKKAISRLVAFTVLHSSLVIMIRSVTSHPLVAWMWIAFIAMAANGARLLYATTPYSKKDEPSQEDVHPRSAIIKVLVFPLLAVGCITLLTTLQTMSEFQYTGRALMMHSGPKLDTSMAQQTAVVLILSSWSSLGAARRQMVRETALKLMPSGLDYRFVLGEPPSPWIQARMGRHLLEESKTYGDLLVVPASDIHSGPKLFEALQWSLQVDYDYLIKTDDDVFVRWDVLGREVKALGRRSAYWKGLRYRHMPPDFDRQGQVRVSGSSSKHDYPMLLLPDYASGTLFTVSRDMISVAAQNKGPRVYAKTEDQSMALWLFSTQARPIHDPRIQDLDVCEEDQIARRCKSLSDMTTLFHNIQNNKPQCTLLDTTRCAVCYPCHGKSDDWRQYNLECDFIKGVSPKELPYERIPVSPVRDTLEPSTIGQNDAWIMDNVLSRRTSKYSEGKDWQLLHWVCWTSDPSTFTDRHWRALELVWIHEPRAEIFMLSNTLPGDFFKDYVRRGFHIQVIEFNKQNLLNWGWYFGPGTRDWLESWEKWEKGSYFYWHLTDYLRYVLMYNYGGTYMDMDALWIRAPPDPELEFIGSDVSSLESDRTWTLDDSRLYLPQGVMRFKRGLVLFREMAESVFSAYTYDPSCFNCGGPKAITAYVREHRSTLEKDAFTILPREVLYPANYVDIHKWLLPNALAEQELATDILPHSWSIHLFGKMTNNLQIQYGSVVDHVLKRFDLDLPHRDTRTESVISSTNTYDVPLRLVGPRQAVYRALPTSTLDGPLLLPVPGKFQGWDVIYVQGGPTTMAQVMVEATVGLGHVQLGNGSIAKTTNQTLKDATQKDINAALHSLEYHPSALHLANGGRDSLHITLHIDDTLVQELDVMVIIVEAEE